MWGGHAWRVREVRAYNGGLGSEPPAGFRAEPLVSESGGGAKPPPPSLKPFSFWCPTKAANLPHSSYIFDRPPTRVKTHRICINRRNDLWQKWGEHVHLSPPRGDASEFDSLACPPIPAKLPALLPEPETETPITSSHVGACVCMCTSLPNVIL